MCIPRAALPPPGLHSNAFFVTVLQLWDKKKRRRKGL